MGTAIPTAKTKNLNIRTSESDYETIRKAAEFNGRSMSSFILNLVYDYLDDLEDIEVIKEHEKAKARGDVEYISWEQVQKAL